MEELFDVLDKNLWFTQKTISREEAHKNGILHRAVVLFVVNSKNQILMQKRSLQKKKWPGCWDVSCGGHVNSGEIGIQAAKRELKEELGIDVDLSDIRYISCNLSENKTEKIWDRHINEFFVTFKDVDNKKIELQESEVEEINWIDFEDFKELTKSHNNCLTPKWEAYESIIMYLTNLK